MSSSKGELALADHSECADYGVKQTPCRAEGASNGGVGESCIEVPAEEYEVHVVEATNLYTRLRFSLLASSWLPRRVGVCLWSVLHVTLAVYVPVMLLSLFSTVLVLAVVGDTMLLYIGVGNVLFLLVIIPSVLLGFAVALGVASALAWIWLIITCQCCTMAARSPGQSLGLYILSAGGVLRGLDPQPGPVEGVGTAAPSAPNPSAAMCPPKVYFQFFFTVTFFKHVKLVSIPYWRLRLQNICQEIVPLYDTEIV